MKSEPRDSRPRPRRGLTIFLTGLPASGKSTLAKVLSTRILEQGDRQVTLLDGDVVREWLSPELDFSKEHRDLNIRRVAFVASEVTRHGGVAICAVIAPYDRARREARAIVERFGGFCLVHVATPLAVCERRDRKGLYAKARAGLIERVTGISDPYEVPTDADATVDMAVVDQYRAAEIVLSRLAEKGY